MFPGLPAGLGTNGHVRATAPTGTAVHGESCRRAPVSDPDWKETGIGKTTLPRAWPDRRSATSPARGRRGRWPTACSAPR